MIDFQKYNVRFHEVIDNGEYLTKEFYFTASPDILDELVMLSDYDNIISAELCVEMPCKFPAPAFCACRISPTRSIENGLEDDDWHDIALSDEEIDNLLKLVGGHNE